MAFTQEFLTALHSGAGSPALLEIVRRHYSPNDPGKEAYETLEQIWRNLGFVDSDAVSSQRDELEYVMERVWYFGANAG